MSTGREGDLMDELVTVEQLEKRLRDLLSQIGRADTCRGCGKIIVWVMHRNRKWVPYTAHGLNHFIDCPNAKDFRKKQGFV